MRPLSPITRYEATQRNTTPLWLWLLKVVLAAAATLAACFIVLLYITPRTVDMDTLAQVEQRIDLHFPQGTQLLAAKLTDGYISAVLTAKLTMPRDQLNRLISGKPFLGHTEDTRKSMTGEYGNPHNIEGWDVDAAKVSLGTGALYHNRQYATWLFADITDPETAVVYLRWDLQ